MFGPVIRGVLALAFATFAVSLSSFVEAAQAPRVTIHQLKTDWKRYEGRTVQLRGQIDGCVSVCSICPTEMTHESYDPLRCLEIAFSGFTFDAHDRVADILLRRAYRFSEVTVEGKFNALCLLDERGKFVGDWACTDGPPHLTNLRILDLHARKRPVDSVYGGMPGGIVPALPADRDAMLMEFSAVDPVPTFKPEMFTIRYHDTGDLDAQRDRDHSTPDGLACVCIDGNCDGRWPTVMLFSPGDPYHCWYMRKTENGWRIVPHDFWWGLTP